MRFYAYCRIGLAGACFGVGVICLYGFIDAERSIKKGSNLFLYDWCGVAQKRNVIPIAVIGSGPAGLSAAMYGARAGMKAVVFEGDEPGGLLIKTGEVQNWPGSPDVTGPEVMERLRKQACSFGVVCITDVIEKVDFSRWPFLLQTAEGDTFYALTVVISTGAAPRLLNIEGEQEYWGCGVSACARCDAGCYKDREVVVVGGGDSAIEEALQLAPYAKKITIIHRRDQLRAAPNVRKRIEPYENINVLYDVRVKRIVGDDNGVTAVELINNQTQKTDMMPIDGVFLAVGHEPRTSIFKDALVTNDQGYIMLEGRSQVTNIPGVFAAGDVADPHYRQAGTAAGDGIKAGIDAVNFLFEVGFTTHRAKELAKNMFGVDEQLGADVHHITSADEFECLIAVPGRLVVATFYMPQEQSSSQMLEIVNVAAKEADVSISFSSVNIVANTTLAKRFHISKTPCLLAFADGKLVARYSDGMQSIDELLHLIRQVSQT